MSESDGGPPCPPPPPVFQTYARQLSGDSRDHEVTSDNVASRSSLCPDKADTIRSVSLGKKSKNKFPVHLGDGDDDDDDDGDGLLILGGRDKRYSEPEPLLTAPTRYVHKSE